MTSRYEIFPCRRPFFPFPSIEKALVREFAGYSPKCVRRGQFFFQRTISSFRTRRNTAPCPLYRQTDRTPLLLTAAMSRPPSPPLFRETAPRIVVFFLFYVLFLHFFVVDLAGAPSLLAVAFLFPSSTISTDFPRLRQFSTVGFAFFPFRPVCGQFLHPGTPRRNNPFFFLQAPWFFNRRDFCRSSSLTFSCATSRRFSLDPRIKGRSYGPLFAETFFFRKSNGFILFFDTRE